MRMSLPVTLPLAAFAVSLGLAVPTSRLSAQDAGETFTAFAVNMNASGASATSTVDIHIDRWSSDADRTRLLSILQEEPDRDKANQELLKALQALPKLGYIRTATSVGWDLRYARQTEMEDGGRRIVVGTDRPIGGFEARNQSRTLDYPFEVVEMHLNKDDTGQGKLLAGTKIYIDKSNNLVLENYDIQPVMLNEIHKVK
jgi:hypothetical protein